MLLYAVSIVTCQLQHMTDLYALQAKEKKPLFVQFVLENMWAVYDAVLLNRSAPTHNHCIHINYMYVVNYTYIELLHVVIGTRPALRR